MINCKNCKRKVNVTKSVISQGEIKNGCEFCIDELIQGNPNAAKYKRDMQRIDYRRDITQPIDPRNFIKAYPEKAKEIYSPETLRKYS